jgi:hypothetical protein
MAFTNAPEKTSTSPKTMNNGMGRSTKVLMEEKTLWMNWGMPIPPPQMMKMNIIFTAIKDKKTGSPIASRNKNAPIISANHIHHSICMFLLLKSLFTF